MEHPLCIVSGGQTGADRAALDAAIRLGLPHGGWCPAGRAAEDGPIPARYALKETPSPHPDQRTEWNVRDTDATVVLSLGPHLRGGSARTIHHAEIHRRPWLHLHRQSPDPTAALRAFLDHHQPHVLHVAGPRASEEPEIGDFVTHVLEQVLTRPAAGRDAFHARQWPGPG